MADLGWGRCPLNHGQAFPGYVVPFKAGGRFREPWAVRIGIHPSEHALGACIGSRQHAPVLPIAKPPTAAQGLALQRAAMDVGGLW